MNRTAEPTSRAAGGGMARGSGALSCAFRWVCTVWIAALVLFWPHVPLWAHGVNGHVWVSERGLAALAACDPALQQILDDPDARNAYRFGAAFPDSGYTTSRGREYGETAHWEPFLQTMIEDWRVRFGRAPATPEARRYAAFILGLAQHGLQDELFDSLFMRRAREHGEDEDLIDTGTDFVLVEDGVADVRPSPWYPPGITAVFAAAGVTVDIDVIDSGVFAIDTVVLGLQDTRPDGLADEYRSALTWTTAHILDPGTPGAHVWEQQFVAPYVEQLWLRLSLPPDGVALRDPLIGLVPVSDGVVAATDAATIRSWVTLVLGVGVRVGDLAGRVSVTASDGTPVDVVVRGSRWAGRDDDYSRLIQISPAVSWTPGQSYTVRVDPTLRTVDGIPFAQPIVTRFSVCRAEDCADDAGAARSDADSCNLVRQQRVGAGCTAVPHPGGGWCWPALLWCCWIWRRR